MRPLSQTHISWTKTGILKAIIVSWIVFVFLRFFTPIRNPFPDLHFLFQTDRFADVLFSKKILSGFHLFSDFLIGLWIMGILWDTGKRLGDWLNLDVENKLMGFCLDFGLGILFFNGIWLGLGLTGLWFPELWWAGALISSFFLTRTLIGKSRGDAWRAVHFHRLEVIDFVLALMACIYLIFAFVQSFLPETFYDSLNYFLGMPCYWLFHHGISDYPCHILSGYFHGGSLFFMNGLVFSDTEGAKLLNVFILILCALCACAWVHEASPRGNSLGLFAVCVTFPLLYLNGWAARVDGLIALTVLLFFYCLFKTHEKTDERIFSPLILVTALMAGLAISIKPSAVTAVAAGFIACLWGVKPKIWLSRSFWTSWVFSICFLVGPWLLKNFAYTGNPFFPYAIHLLGGRMFSEAGYQRLLLENTQYLPMNQGLWSYISLPWRLTMPQAGDGQFIGPVLLAFGPLLLFVKFDQPILRRLARATLIYFLLGLCLSHMLRFIMPAFLAAFILLSVSQEDPGKKFWRPLWLSGVFLSALLSLPVFLRVSADYYDPTGIWTGRETVKDYLSRKLLNSYEPMADWIGVNLPRDARLLVAGDSRGVYYPREFLANSAFDEPFFQEAARSGKNPGDILKKLQRSGITHIAVNVPEGMRIAESYGQYLLEPRGWKILTEFVRTGLEPLYYKDFMAVYRVKNTLSAPNGSYLVNPFSFFYRPAYDLLMKEKTMNLNLAEKEAGEILSVFPNESYWWEKKAKIEISLHNPTEADKDFRTGDSRGILTREGYRVWADLAVQDHDLKTARFAAQRSQSLYAFPGEKK